MLQSQGAALRGTFKNPLILHGTESLRETLRTPGELAQVPHAPSQTQFFTLHIRQITPLNIQNLQDHPSLLPTSVDF